MRYSIRKRWREAPRRRGERAMKTRAFGLVHGLALAASMLFACESDDAEEAREDGGSSVVDAGTDGETEDASSGSETDAAGEDAGSTDAGVSQDAGGGDAGAQAKNIVEIAAGEDRK